MNKRQMAQAMGNDSPDVNQVGLTFWAMMSDAGNGAVNLALSRGTGSATFTRATAATTVLSTGLIANVSSGVARSYYDPAPTGGQGSYMYLPGVSGAYASTPDSVPVSITGDIDLRAQVALTDWTPAVSGSVIAKLSSGSTRSYRFYPANTTGNLMLEWSTDGSATATAVSTAVAPFSDGAIGWVRVTLDVDNGAGGYTVAFYTSTDGVTWTQLGNTVTGGAPTSIFDSNSPVEIGSSVAGAGTLMVGRVYRAQVYNGINGTLVADFDPARTTQASTSFAASTGETWTVNGRGLIYAAPAYLGYLAEEARTNLVLRSEDFSAAWAAVGTPTRSAAAKTCGTVNMDLIGDDSAAALEGYTQTITYTGDATKAVSIFVAQGTSASTMIRLRDTTASADRLLAAITWSGGLPIITMTTGTSQGYTIFPGSIFRIQLLTTSVTAANTNSIQVYPASDAALAVTGTGDVYAGGVQSENGAFSTSYIPTAGATVTRNADVLTYPSAGNVIDASGTFFGKATAFWASGSTFYIAATDANGRFAYNSGVATAFNNFDGTTVGAGGPGTSFQNREAKFATSWAASTKTSYLDSVPAASSAYDGTFVTGAIAIGCNNAGAGQWNGCIRDIRFWQRQLSASQIASIR